MPGSLDGGCENGRGKNYFVRSDVIGRMPEGPRIMADNDNTVYINLSRIREESNDPRNPLRSQLSDFLTWLNDSIQEQHGESLGSGKEVTSIRTAANGVISWDASCDLKDVIYVTDDPRAKNEYLSKGHRVTIPDFLRYGMEPLYSGLLKAQVNVSDERLLQLGIEDLCEATGHDALHPNQFVLVNGSIVYGIRQNLREVREGSGRYQLVGDPSAVRVDYKFPIDNIMEDFSPKDLEQRIAFHQLMDPNIDLCIVSGKHSSGKTVITYAAGLQLVLGNERMRKAGAIKRGIRIYKPADLVGGKDREVGYLPGDIEEKTGPWFDSWEDAHREVGLGSKVPYDFLFLDPQKMGKDGKPERDQKFLINVSGKNYHFPARNPVMMKGHLPFERGRTHSGVVMMIDEAQNLKPEEMWSFITRAGEGTKVIVSGDPVQVDHPKLSKEFNGLVWLANRIRETNYPRSSIIHLPKGYRSQLAEVIGEKDPPRIA